MGSAFGSLHYYSRDRMKGPGNSLRTALESGQVACSPFKLARFPLFFAHRIAASVSLLGKKMAPSPAQARELYRALVREARKFSNYNIREYVKRRTVAGFHDQHADPAAAYAVGKEQLELAKRQAVVYNLYAPRMKSIMDLS